MHYHPSRPVTTTLTGTNSSSSLEDWMELCKRTRPTPCRTTNSSRYSGSEEKLWQSVKCMQLSWRQPTSTGKKMATRGSLTMMSPTSLKTLKKMRGKFLIFTFRSLMGPTPFMSLCPTSSSMGSTALGHEEEGSPFTGRSFSPYNNSPLTRRGSTPSGSSMCWVTPPAMMPWRPTL